jgi:hypothetical protein
MRTGIGTIVCDGCNKRADDDMIVTEWASGDHYYCGECWSKHRDYYESEFGRAVWKQTGNRYALNWGDR